MFSLLGLSNLILVWKHKIQYSKNMYFLTQTSKDVVSKRTLFVWHNSPVTTEVSNCFVNTDNTVNISLPFPHSKSQYWMWKADDLSNQLWKLKI
jgi:hypothetical protein